jgi:release factor glutamine methyltransferase
MTRQQALARARELLDRHKIEDSSLEAEILLKHTLKIDRTQLFTEIDSPLKKRQEDTYRTFIKRRIKGEPSAYITGHREFFGLDFLVDKRVLIPRPETEILVEQAIARAGNYRGPIIVDVGTGCGAIAVSLALHLPHAEIHAVDISKAALKVATRNCLKHGVEDRVKLLVGDLLEPVPITVDIIVANLPYVLTAEVPQVNTSGFEPPLALDGGVDGMDMIKRLCLQAHDKLRPAGCLLLEIGMGQSKIVSGVLREFFPAASVEFVSDLSDITRVVCMTLPVSPAQIAKPITEGII